MSVIDHNLDKRQFSTEVDGLRAVLDYRLSDRVMTITHTGVPQPVSGRGIAAELMKAALKVATSEGWQIDPACSYAAAYLRRHPVAALHQEGS